MRKKQCCRLRPCWRYKDEEVRGWRARGPGNAPESVASP